MGAQKQNTSLRQISLKGNCRQHTGLRRKGKGQFSSWVGRGVRTAPQPRKLSGFARWNGSAAGWGQLALPILLGRARSRKPFHSMETLGFPWNGKAQGRPRGFAGSCVFHSAESLGFPRNGKGAEPPASHACESPESFRR